MTVGPKLYKAQVFTPYQLMMVQNIETVQMAEMGRKYQAVDHAPQTSRLYESQVLNSLDIAFTVLPKVDEAI